MSATPLLVITDAGNVAASIATPTGPYIHITKFAIGSAFGYDPDPTDVGLNGTLLYEGAPSAYVNIGDNTINIVLRLPPDAGPFDFGEVAVYLEDGTMFAKAAFDTLQTKYSSLGTNLLSTYTFNCLLKLEQSTAVFKISTDSGLPPAVWEVDKWSDVYPPALSANPDIPLILVKELTDKGYSTLLHRSNDDKWTVGTTYEYFDECLVANGATTWVDVDKDDFEDTADLLTAVNRKFVLGFPDGVFRSVLEVVDSGDNLRFNLNPDALSTLPVSGSTITIYADSSYLDRVVDFADLRNVPIASRTDAGIAKVGDGIAIIGAGNDTLKVSGLLHGAPGTGKRLTAADTLNNAALPSGIYTCYSSYPVGYPPGLNLPGTITVENTVTDLGDANGTIVQTYKPRGAGGGASSGIGGVPWYMRSYLGGGAWTNWFPFQIADKAAPGSSSSLYAQDGYRIYEDGYIEQWGFAPVGNDSGMGITFLIAFPNACFGVYSTRIADMTWSGGKVISSHNSAPTRFGFTAYTSADNTSYSQGLFWHARGN